MTGLGIGRYIVGAVLLAVAGSICLAASRVDRALARTQECVVTGAYAEAEEAFDTAARYLGYASWIPAVGRRLNDVQARRASMHYWRRDYDRLVPSDVDPIAGIPAENAALQLITANAVYRKSQPGAKDRPNALRALDAAINAYVAVLRNSGADEATAYNYEYLVRAREDIDKGRRPADLTEKAEDGPAGEQGGLAPEDNKQDLKILIPLDPAEMDKAIDPGKGTPIERKG
jgi:hypothetical protein